MISKAASFLRRELWHPFVDKFTSRNFACDQRLTILLFLPFSILDSDESNNKTYI